MTTAHSPLRVLKKQASTIAAVLKAAERGEKLDVPHSDKIVAARARESVTFGLVMDDKVLNIEMTWATIRDTSETGIAEYILKHMRGAREKD